MPSVYVQAGDIVTVPSDALITAINSTGQWFGGVDRAIMGVAKDTFHRQAREQMPLTDGDVIYAPAMERHGGQFGSVIFVVDDLVQQLRNIVLAGLRKAEEQGMKTVTIPSLRTGVARTMFEPTVDQALDEMVTAIKTFTQEAQVVQGIHVVVHYDRSSLEYLRKQLGLE